MLSLGFSTIIPELDFNDFSIIQISKNINLKPYDGVIKKPS
ncbi:hypothetical protein HMPREF3226_00691 [Prevotella corporis]|uniref:Uncharacterized protein n=1 Tax=Prevotella corporis TaxID=28128 RepID=A0A133QHJ0_9BACT|nr:hypothetical protein HMPREF3226_00691 [Prevotella corporis]